MIYYLPLSIGPFPNWFPVGPYPPLHGRSVSPNKVLLGSFRLSILPCSSKLPVDPWSCWTYRKWTGRLACQNRRTLPVTHVPFPAHWHRPLQRLDTLATLCGDEIFLTTPSPARFLRSRISCELSRLRCHCHSLLLSPYLCRIKLKENSSCNACGHPLQDLTHLLLDCLASEPLRRAIFGTTSSIFDPWSKPWGVVQLLGLCRVLPRPHPSEGVG